MDVDTALEFRWHAMQISSKTYDDHILRALRPAKLPQAVIDKLLPAFTTALQDAAVQEAIRKEGYDLISMTPAQMQKQIAQDLDSWGKVIKSANVSYD